MRQSAKSARLPTSSVPSSRCRPRAHAACRVAPASASSGVRPNKVQAMLSTRRSEVQGEVPGFASVDTAMGTPRRAASRPAGGRLAQRVIGAGQEHRHRSGRRERLDAALAHELEMIRGQCAIGGRELRAAHVAQLTGMQMGGETKPLCRCQKRPGLIERECDVLAERVHRIDETFAASDASQGPETCAT